jgi:hypothetical protein
MDELKQLKSEEEQPVVQLGKDFELETQEKERELKAENLSDLMDMLEEELDEENFSMLVDAVRGDAEEETVEEESDMDEDEEDEEKETSEKEETEKSAKHKQTESNISVDTEKSGGISFQKRAEQYKQEV